MSITINQKVIFAVRAGNLELVKERVADGGDIDYHDEKYGSAITEAIRSNQLTILTWLAENGANFNIEYSHDIGSLEIALHHDNANYNIVQLLLTYGAKLRKKTRQYYKERLEACMKNG